MYTKISTLAELTSNFELPQSARVVEGYYGPTESSKISQDTILLMCFKKETKVVLAEDAYEMTYSIPRDSSLMYIPLDPTYGLQGHVYSSVEEILQSRELPKVVHINAQTAFTLRLHSGNQLIFPAKKERSTFGKDGLICYDQKDNKFTLPATLCGLFSTKADDIRMYMDDCINHIRKLPVKVAICDVNNMMPPDTDGSILTLTSTKNEQSVVAKTISKTGGVSTRMIEIPINIPIKLQCLQTNPHRNKVEAEEVCKAYDNSMVKDYCNTAATETAYELQNQLYMNVKPLNTSTQDKYVTMRRQVKSVSDETKNPRRNTSYEPMYENLKQYKTPPHKPVKPQRSQGNNDSSYLPRQSFSLPAATRLSSVVAQNKNSNTQPQAGSQPTTGVTEADTTTDDKVDEIYTTIPSSAEDTSESDDYIRVISPPAPQQLQQPKQLERIHKLEASNEELRTQLIQVTARLIQLESSVNQILQLVVTRKPEDNIKQLSFLDAETVVGLLRAMGLSMYEHIFREHRVDGVKMTRLDSKKLSQYGITNPQDQTKLMDVIKGSVSPLSYLLRQLPSSSSNNEDGYVRFTKT